MYFRQISSVVVFVLTLSTHGQSNNLTLPAVTIFATGGTIAGVDNSTTATTGYKDATLAVDVLIAAVPELKQVARVTGYQYSSIGSENVNSTLLLGLSKLVNKVLANGTANGVVITHGTDTLEESGLFLDLTYNGTLPVVLVASMRPSTALSADGPFNIFQAVALAASKSARSRGVMLTLNDRIGSAMYTTKTNTRALDTFKAYEQGYLGVFLDETPVFYFEPARYSNKPYFDVSNVTKLPAVNILYGYQEMDVSLLYAAAKVSAGIVVACTGDGTLPATWISAAANITSRGIPVVRASRTGQSFVAPSKGYLSSANYNPQKARILLQLALHKYGGGNTTLLQGLFDATSI